jgi:hypothetical protein
MSTKRYLEFEIRGSPGNIDSVFNRFNLGLSQVGQRVGSSQRQLGLWDQQIRAIGTTLRYAFAGSVVFGITGAIQTLGDFNVKLGEIEGLAARLDQQGHLQRIGGQIDEIGRFARQTALQWGIATEDILGYTNRFWSSFEPSGNQRHRMQEMRDFVSQIAILRRALGGEAGDPEQLAGGIAGFIRGIPGGTRNIGASTRRVSNIVSEVTRLSPVITGTDISRDIGRLGAAQTAMRMTPEELFSVYGLASQAGGSPSVIGRGVTQLLSNALLRPRTTEEKEAFAQMGLPTDANALRQMGGMAVLTQMLRRTGKVSLSGAQANAVGTTDDPTEAITGISGGNISLASRALGRPEAFRQFIILASQGVDALERYQRTLVDGEKTNRVLQRAQIVQSHNVVNTMGEARRQLGLSAIQTIQWPYENIVGRPMIGAAGLAIDHPRIAQGATAVVGGVAAASALSRLIGGKGLLSRIGGKAFKGLRGVVGADLAMEAAPNLVSGQHADGTRANPIWVMIHPASWYVGSPGGMGAPTSSSPGSGGLWNKLKNNPWFLPAAGVSATVAATAGVGYGLDRFEKKYMPGFANTDNSKGFLYPFDQIFQHRNGGHKEPVPIEGNANLDLTIRLVDAQGRTIKIEQGKGVPVKLWGAGTPPTSRGKARDPRGTR